MNQIDQQKAQWYFDQIDGMLGELVKLWQLNSSDAYVFQLFGEAVRALGWAEGFWLPQAPLKRGPANQDWRFACPFLPHGRAAVRSRSRGPARSSKGISRAASKQTRHSKSTR